MTLIDRVQAILLKPKETWPRIAAEGGDVAGIFTGYVMILAAIPALAGFVGLAVFGIGGFGVTVRIGIVPALINLVVGYLLTLVMVYVLALIVEALAPTFGGTKDRLAALKVVAYSRPLSGSPASCRCCRRWPRSAPSSAWSGRSTCSTPGCRC